MPTASVQIPWRAYRRLGQELQVGATKCGNARADGGHQIGRGWRRGNRVPEDLGGVGSCTPKLQAKNQSWPASQFRSLEDTLKRCLRMRAVTPVRSVEEAAHDRQGIRFARKPETHAPTEPGVPRAYPVAIQRMSAPLAWVRFVYLA